MSRGGLVALDLSRLAPPPALEALDYEALLAELLADYRARYPQWTAVLESEPVMALIETFAYGLLLFRHRVNDAVRAVMPATATGTDLEHLGAFFGVARLAGEDDERLRRRVTLAPEAYAAAGPAGAYVFHALSVDSGIADVSVTSPAPGQVLVTLLAAADDGAVAVDTVAAVQAALTAEQVRPLTDMVSVRGAEIVPYVVDAGLIVLPGPDGETVRAKARQAAMAYARRQRRLGADVTISGLHAALHVAGVERVLLRAPAASLAIAPTQASWATSVTVTVDGHDG